MATIVTSRRDNSTLTRKIGALHIKVIILDAVVYTHLKGHVFITAGMLVQVYVY